MAVKQKQRISRRAAETFLPSWHRKHRARPAASAKCWRLGQPPTFPACQLQCQWSEDRQNSGARLGTGCSIWHGDILSATFNAANKEAPTCKHLLTKNAEKKKSVPEEIPAVCALKYTTINGITVHHTPMRRNRTTAASSAFVAFVGWRQAHRARIEIEKLLGGWHHTSDSICARR